MYAPKIQPLRAGVASTSNSSAPWPPIPLPVCSLGEVLCFRRLQPLSRLVDRLCVPNLLWGIRVHLPQCQRRLRWFDNDILWLPSYKLSMGQFIRELHLKVAVRKGATAPGARGKTDIDSYLTAPTGPHRPALRRSFEPVSRLEGWLMSPRLHRSRKGRTFAFEKSYWSCSGCLW